MGLTLAHTKHARSDLCIVYEASEIISIKDFHEESVRAISSARL